jgi:hypothetical protein
MKSCSTIRKRSVRKQAWGQSFNKEKSLQLWLTELCLCVQYYWFLPRKQSILLQKPDFFNKIHIIFWWCMKIILWYKNSFHKKFAPLAERAFLYVKFGYSLLQKQFFWTKSLLYFWKSMGIQNSNFTNFI